MAERPEVDEVTGVETMGHEWDGLKELNNPLPRWWLWVLWTTVVWAIGYWIAMPAWPTLSGYTKGLLGYSQRATVARKIDAARAAKSGHLDRIRDAGLNDIVKNPDLLEFALAGGRSAYGVNCSQCHGAGAAGSVGFPNLNDDDWLWGGSLATIAETIRVGIRAAHDDTRTSDMPAFGKDEILNKTQISDVAEYVLSLSKRSVDTAAAKRGAPIFAEQCAACHGENGKGNREFGAPNLTDSIWLYGGTRRDVVATITNARRGVMPAWEGRLDPVTIKLLAVYVHSLGGGETGR